MPTSEYHKRDPPDNSCVVVTILVAVFRHERLLQSMLPEGVSVGSLPG
jgi:hypothetical protein